LRRIGLGGCLFALSFAHWSYSSELAVIVLNPSAWVKGNLPPEWHVKIARGRADVETCSGTDGCVRLKSEDSSFGLEREVNIDAARTPKLTWSWKVTQLPGGGDFRHKATDDQAAQLLVAFSDRHILSYIWDSTAPKGTMEAASSFPLVHIFAIVCESGPSLEGKWVSESRDVAADYERAFAKPAPHIKGLRLQINSQHTGTAAESYFGEVAFRSKTL